MERDHVEYSIDSRRRGIDISRRNPRGFQLAGEGSWIDRAATLNLGMGLSDPHVALVFEAVESIVNASARLV